MRKNRYYNKKLLKISSDYPDNSFRPDAPMTRAEFCVMVKRLKNLNTQIAIATCNNSQKSND